MANPVLQSGNSQLYRKVWDFDEYSFRPKNGIIGLVHSIEVVDHSKMNFVSFVQNILKILWYNTVQCSWHSDGIIDPYFLKNEEEAYITSNGELNRQIIRDFVGKPTLISYFTSLIVQRIK